MNANSDKEIVRFTVRMPKNLVDKLDYVCGRLGVNRASLLNYYISKSVESELKSLTSSNESLIKELELDLDGGENDFFKL